MGIEWLVWGRMEEGAGQGRGRGQGNFKLAANSGYNSRGSADPRESLRKRRILKLALTAHKVSTPLTCPLLHAETSNGYIAFARFWLRHPNSYRFNNSILYYCVSKSTAFGSSPAIESIALT